MARGGVTLASVGAPLLVPPALLLILESLLLPPLYVDRYVLYGEAGAALLAGAGMWRAGRWLAGRWVAGHCCGHRASCLRVHPGPAAGAAAAARTPGSRLYNFGGPSQYVGANEHQGDGVMFFGTLFRKARNWATRRTSPAPPTSPCAKSPEQAGTFRGTDKTFPAVLSADAGVPADLGDRPGALGACRRRLLRAESVVLQARFRLVAQRRFSGIAVTLWQRR